MDEAAADPRVLSFARGVAMLRGHRAAEERSLRLRQRGGFMAQQRADRAAMLALQRGRYEKHW